MTGKRIRELSPTSRRYVRHPTHPIGSANTVTSAVRAAEEIVNLARRAGTLLVLVDPSGSLYAMPHNCERARTLSKEKTFWIVGVFNRLVLVRDLADAIVFAFRDIGGRPA
jgi:hypothetical protein